MMRRIEELKKKYIASSKNQGPKKYNYDAPKNNYLHQQKGSSKSNSSTDTI